MKKIINDRFIVSAKVGSKGQIVIPIEAREMFNIEPGDTLMVLSDRKRGLAIMKDDVFYQLMENKK